MRALGLEPSLVRGKSPVPYQSGVARQMWAGRESNPLCRKTAGLQPAAPHGATDPTVGPGGAGPNETMPMRLSRCCGPDGMPGAHARKESNPQPAVLETAAPPWLERKKDEVSAQAVVRAERKVAGTLGFSVELPADDDGPAGIGGFPSSWPPLMT